MKISLNWLKDFVDIPKNITPQQLAEDLSVHTVEVEEVIDQQEMYRKMVVGQIKEIKDHPNADKLKVCEVDLGNFAQKDPPRSPLGKEGGKAQIVCGGTNIYEGMKVAVALPGAKVRWHGEGELVELKKTKIRGVDSQGMICSSNEIGLDDFFRSHSGPSEESTTDAGSGISKVTDLQGIKAKPGTPLGKALGVDDVVFGIDNKSLTNRPDLWSHFGIAREIAAFYNVSLRGVKGDEAISKSSPRLDHVGAGDDSKVKIKIQDKKLCQRYIGAVVENIKIEPSPDWMQARLRAVGQRPINNIVDITNYVMFELGEPTHAFDADKIANKHTPPSGHPSQEGNKKSPPTEGWTRSGRGGSLEIFIRQAKKRERLVTLDDQERKLDESILVIADSKGPIALAGLMGGANTEVDEKTTTMLFEAANFDAGVVRRMSQKLNLRTEGSNRWEKSVDPALAETAMARALELIQGIEPKAQIKFIEDVDYSSKQRTKIIVSHDFLEKRIGQKLRQKEITGILERLGFKTKILKRVQDDFSYDLTVPSWRSTGDVSIAEDIVEEVARIYGYNKLAKASLHVELIKPVLSSGYSTERRVKNFLAIGAGMSEVFNYAWDEQHILQKLYGPGWQVDRQALANPPADEHKYLKNSLVPGLVKNLADNLRFSKEFRIFEIARVFTSGQGSQDGQDKIPGQPKFLAGAVVGKESFFVAKGVAEGLLESLGLWFEWRAQRSGRFASPGMSLKLKVAGEELGSAFLLESNTAAVVDIDREASFFEIDISKLARLTAEAVKFRVIPEFPAIDRDVALVVDKKVTYSEILSLIESSSTLLSGVRLFDVYQGKQIGTSKKQYAFRLVFQDMKKTLTSEEAEAELKVIIDQLKKKVGAQLRS